MSHPHHARSTRARAARILVDWFQSGDFPDRLIETAAPRHRAMVMELVYGCVRHARELDFFIGRLTARPPDPPVRALLHVGLYQLFHMDQTAAYAAVHETVEAARALGRGRATGMVNAVLRAAQRQQGELAGALQAQPLAVRASHPDLLVERWTQRWGAADTEALCHWNNRRAHVCVRPIPARLSVPDFVSRLQVQGIQAEPHPCDPQRFVHLPHGVRVPTLPGYDDGAFFVQDPATTLAVDLLDVRPGLRVLDACAAPGGKTLLLAEALTPSGADSLSGLLVASDTHADRRATLCENLQRMRRPEVLARTADAAHPESLRRIADELAPDGFDRVLLDVPCSNTGVIQRRPDARYRVDLARLASLQHTQQAMLTAAAAVLHPEGQLVYSTCSLEPEENEEGVRAWLTEHPAWHLCEERRLFPPAVQTDGAYAARLQRR